MHADRHTDIVKIINIGLCSLHKVFRMET